MTPLPGAPQGPHQNGWIATDERYVVMPWKMVTRHGKNMTLAEAVEGILSHQKSEMKERERREREREEIESKHKEYYETHMKKETERLNNWVGWHKRKLKEIDEAPVDSRLRMLERLYQISEKNKNCGVTITRAGVINPVNYPVYRPELKLHEYEDNNEEDPFCDAPKPGSLPAGCNPCNQLYYFRQIIRAYQERDEDVLNMLRKLTN